MSHRQILELLEQVTCAMGTSKYLDRAVQMLNQEAEQTAALRARITELTQSDKSVADAFRLWREELAAWREVDADHKRLVRELDVLWNGEEKAAKQASLCDVVSQIGKELADVRQLNAIGEANIKGIVEYLEDQEKLRAENANLRAAVAGRTMFHSDEAVNAEMGRIREELESVKGENERIVADARQCHSRNDEMVAEHLALRTEIQRLEKEARYLSQRLAGEKEAYQLSDKIATERMHKAESALSRCRADALEDAARAVEGVKYWGTAGCGSSRKQVAKVIRSLQTTPPSPSYAAGMEAAAKMVSDELSEVHSQGVTRVLVRVRDAIRSAAKDTTPAATNSTVGEAG